jgi:hypothetical protein
MNPEPVQVIDPNYQMAMIVVVYTSWAMLVLVLAWALEKFDLKIFWSKTNHFAPAIALILFSVFSAINSAQPYFDTMKDFGISERAAIKQPNNYRAQLNTSYDYLEAEYYPLALHYAERAIKIHPDRPKCYINAMTAAVGLQAYERGLEHAVVAFNKTQDKRIAQNILFLCDKVPGTEQLKLEVLKSLHLLKEREPWEPTL